jgi:hypothetical protein
VMAFLGIYPKAYDNVMRWIRPELYATEDRLTNGPNTAKERGILRRRRARLKRQPLPAFYCDTDSMGIEINDAQCLLSVSRK